MKILLFNLTQIGFWGRAASLVLAFCMTYAGANEYELPDPQSCSLETSTQEDYWNCNYQSSKKIMKAEGITPFSTQKYVCTQDNKPTITLTTLMYNVPAKLAGKALVCEYTLDNEGLDYMTVRAYAHAETGYCIGEMNKEKNELISAGYQCSAQ